MNLYKNRLSGKFLYPLVLFVSLFLPAITLASSLVSKTSHVIDSNKLFAQESKYKPYLEIGGAKYFNQNSNVAGIYDLFIPLAQSEGKIFFTDLRIFDRSGSSFEGNAHFGFRKLFLDRKELFGVYAAFDRKRGESRHWFNQLTFGGEYWHDNWFVGGNLYRTIGQKEVLINEGSFETPITTGVDIGVARTITTRGSYERSLFGIDAEVGYTFTDNLTGYISGYYFTEHNAVTTAGPKIRFTYNYSHPTGRFLGILDGISIEAGAQHDKPRGNTAYIGIKFKVGLTNLGNDKGKNSNLFGFERHMTELVRRDPDIVTGQQDYTTSERKIDFARLEIQDLPQDILLAEFGLTQGATLKEVEKKYREYAKRYHPDRRGGDSREFARYSHLYEVIREKFKGDKEEGNTLHYQPHQSRGFDSYVNINGNNSPNFPPALFEWSSLQRMSDSISLAIQQKPIFAPIRWINNFSNQLFDLFFPIRGVYAIGPVDSLVSSQGIGRAFSGLGLEILPSILPRESLSMDRQIGMRLHQYDVVSGEVAKNQDLVSQTSLGSDFQDQDLNCNFTMFGGISGFSGIMGYSSRVGTENIGDRVNLELCERSNKGCNINYRDIPLYAKSDVSLLSSQKYSQVGYEVVLPAFEEVVVPQPQEESLNIKTTVSRLMDESVVPQSKKVLFSYGSEIFSSRDLKILSSSNLEVLSSSDSKMLFSHDSKMSSRDLIAGSLSQDQIRFKETPQIVSLSDGYSQEINLDYEYEAQDMDVLLPLRAKEEGLNLKNTVILRAIEDRKLENQLLIENFRHLEKLKADQGKINVSHARDLLIPINLPDTHHWIGVIVRIDEFNNPFAAYYLDSLSDSSLRPQGEVNQFFHNRGINIQRAKGLIQCDNTSCGPVAIENLIRVISKLRRKEDPDTLDDSSLILNESETKKIREAHIKLAEKHAPSLRLKERQKYNLRTFEYLSEDGNKARIEISMEDVFQELESEKELFRKLILNLVNTQLFPRLQFGLSAIHGGGGSCSKCKNTKSEDIGKNNKLDVYIGVMAEEVSVLVKNSLNNIGKDESIMVIARGDIIETDELLEQRCSLYPGLIISSGLVAVTSKLGDSDTSSTSSTLNSEEEVLVPIVKRLARKLKEKMINKSDFDKYELPISTPKMNRCFTDDGKSIITVVQIGESKKVKEIFVQLPEMGLQAELSYKFGKSILDSLIEVFGSNRYFSFASYAAGGSIGTSTIPGGFDKITYSICIRAKRRGDHYVGEVSLYYLGGHILLYESKSDDELNFYEALEEARFYFLIKLLTKFGVKKLPEQNEEEIKLSSTYYNCYLNSIEEYIDALKNEKLEIIKRIEDDAKSKFTKHINDYVGVQINTESTGIGISYDDGKVIITDKDKISISANYFTGDKEKMVGNKIGLYLKKTKTDSQDIVVSVNMEDDIIFRIFSKVYRKINYDKDIFLVTRVHCDPYEIDTEISTGLKSWSEIPEKYTIKKYINALQWRLGGFDKELLKEMNYANNYWGFYEKYKETKYRNLFYGYDDKAIVIDPFWREIATDFMDNNVFVNFEKDDLKNFKRLFTYLFERQGEGKLDSKIEELIKDFNINTDNGKINGLDLTFPVWVRENKWGYNKKQRLDKLKFKGHANTDRAFYVSANMPALYNNVKTLLDLVKNKGSEEISED